MAKFRNSHGFSIIEMSVALVIAGFVTFSAIAIFAERSAIDKVAVTEKKLEEIERAIRIYFLENGDLPCVAPGTFALSNSSFGTADETVEGICDHDSLQIGSDYGGVVPNRTLNLPDSYMFDGWGKRITYIISQNCVNLSCAGDLTINDNSATPNTITSEAAYVLISHGENGWGAWGRNGGANQREYNAAISTHEAENAHVAADGSNNSYDSVFRDDYINDTSNVAAADYFDDIVRWKTKEMIDYDADRLP